MENKIRGGSSSCRICGKPLSDLTSVKLGIGPVCRGFYGIDGSGGQAGLFDNHADFSVMEETESFVYIIDTGNHSEQKTVTNDAEWVIRQLAGICNCLEKKRVFTWILKNRLTKFSMMENPF